MKWWIRSTLVVMAFYRVDAHAQLNWLRQSLFSKTPMNESPEDSKTEACDGLCAIRDKEVGLNQLIYNILSNCSKRKQKSAQEIEKYLACYSTPHQKEYDRRYKGMIELAAVHFHVEAPLLKCLLRRESTWNEDLESPTCAYGLGQFLPGTAYDIAKEIGDSQWRTTHHEEAPPGSVRANWDDYMTDLRAHDPKAITGGCNNNFSFLNEDLYYREKKQAYDRAMVAYQNAVKKGKAAKLTKPVPPMKPAAYETSKPVVFVDAKGKEHRRYKKVDCFNNPRVYFDNRGCPAASIAAASVMLLHATERRDRAAPTSHYSCEEYNNMQIANALAYNRGPKGLLSVASKEKNSDLWAREIIAEEKSAGGRSEAADHLISIQNCLDAGNWNPPVGDLKRDCDKPGYPIVKTKATK